MYDVIMKGLYDISYTVIKGVEYAKAVDMKQYLLSTCDEEYFNNLFIKDVVIEPAK